MKRLKIKNWSLLLILPLFVSLFGCEKFLDRKPLTATLEDLNQGGLEGQIFGLYNTAARNAGFSSIPWLAVHGFRADDSQKGSDQADGAEWVTVMDNFNYAKDFWATNTYWDDHYVLINQANTALQTADSLKLADASSLTNIAEARFLELMPTLIWYVLLVRFLRLISVFIVQHKQISPNHLSMKFMP